MIIWPQTIDLNYTFRHVRLCVGVLLMEQYGCLFIRIADVKNVSKTTKLEKIYRKQTD